MARPGCTQELDMAGVNSGIQHRVVHAFLGHVQGQSCLMRTNNQAAVHIRQKGSRHSHLQTVGNVRTLPAVGSLSSGGMGKGGKCAGGRVLKDC